jgi:hypothetical protein
MWSTESGSSRHQSRLRSAVGIPVVYIEMWRFSAAAVDDDVTK